MGQWGVKSYEIDDAADALDAAFERVHGRRYDDLMNDRNPMTIDQIHQELAGADTLAAAIAALQDEFGPDIETWDEVARLAFAGVVVRHAELGVTIPQEIRARALDWLEHEEIDWDQAAQRQRRRAAELHLLRGAAGT